MKAYAGIGSRETPVEILKYMTRVGMYMEKLGWILRSGGAKGADQAFALHVTNKEVYVPWDGFEGHRMDQSQNMDAAMIIAQRYHPYWLNLSHGAKKLHARNVFQILGHDLKTPSKLVICWTPDGTENLTTTKTGGTGQAIRIAVAHGIQVCNLNRQGYQKHLREAFDAVEETLKL